MAAFAAGADDSDSRSSRRSDVALESVMVNPPLETHPVYTIDAFDRIAFVNPAWIAFTHSERGEPRTPQDYHGRPVWDLIEGGQIRQLWEVLYGRVRAIGAAVFVPLRADTPGERRLIDIELRPLADRSIQHVCECVWREARAAVALLDPAWPRDERTLRCCAWCKRIQVRLGAWEEIEEALLTLSIEVAGTLPTLAPDVCMTCKQALLKTFPG